VSHLLLNPLSTASGYLHLFNEDTHGDFTDEQKRRPGQIENSLHRMERPVKVTIKLSP
jgi:hypothetical protein